jgi:hypothetical protein
VELEVEEQVEKELERLSGTAGTDNTGGGGGGGGGSGFGSGAGGSGIIIIQAPNAKVTATGVWSLSDAYNNRKAGTWN